MVVLLVSVGCAAVNVHTAVGPSPSPGYVPWLPLAADPSVFPQAPPAPPSPPIPIPPGTQPCQASQLDAAYFISSAATGGNLDSPVRFRNHSPVYCYLEGYPDLTLLDARGSVLATSAGAASRGTYFPDGPDVPVLMVPGTAALAFTGNPAPSGQAYLNVQWYDCSRPSAAGLSISLPQSGGTLTIPYAVTASYYPTCDTDKTSRAFLRGLFNPSGIEWPPGPAYITLNVTIHAQASVKRGSTLDYFVEIQNTSNVDYALSPCPDYDEFLGAKQGWASYRLNCRPVGHIAPGAGVKFEMRLAVPSTLSSGPSTVTWVLVDGRVAIPHPSAAIAIT